MGQRLKFNLLPSLQPGEKVLFVKKWVGFCTCLSYPNYRWSFSLPPVQDQGLYVTDRRVLHILHTFRLLTVEFHQWFEGKNELSDTELIKEVRTGRNWLCGQYLEIVSENSKKFWYRSRSARIRLYMRNPEFPNKIITAAMTRDAGTNEK
jgi:hypothetical protein